ncbi:MULTISPECIES: hypothetical protein [unclassified Acinetobacter]|uniref:hypothetical protein n=1 Tax=unclassified Acinetobacter TaxID=196816 RepID=UPI0015D3C748|nr:MULTISPECIES: hypothetical protein [unclassified Acinetobacter]
MAVSEQTPYIEYTANGTTTSFALEFECENQDHLIVLVDDVEPVVGTWALNNGAVVFNTAPESGKKITLQRNTPFSRTTDYQSYNNSFRPPAVNNDFDRVWYKIQELGVKDWLLNLKIQKFRDDVNLTALENTLKEAKQIRDDTADSVVEVQSNVALSQTLLGNTTAQANLAQGYASSANSANVAAQQAAVDVNTAKDDVYSALSAQQIAVNNSLTAIAGGHKAYQTLAAAQADQASLPANTIVEVTNDGANNGTYQWNGTTLTKSAYDPLTQAGIYTDKEIAKRVEQNGQAEDLKQEVDAEGKIYSRTDKDGNLFITGLDGKSVQEKFKSSPQYSPTTESDIWSLEDPNGSVVARIDNSGELHVPQINGTVQENINLVAPKFTSVIRDKKHFFIDEVQPYLNNLVASGMGVAPIPLNLMPSNYTVPNTIIDNFKLTPPTGRLRIDTPYYKDDWVVHPFLIECIGTMRGYRYILAINPYTFEAHENPVIYGSNDLINFEMLTGFVQPLDTPPEGGFLSDSGFTYDLNRGELVVYWRVTRRPADGLTYTSYWCKRTKDLYTWTDKEQFFPELENGVDGLTSPAIIFDPRTNLWHLWNIKQAGVIVHRTASDLFGEWSEPVIVPSGSTVPWHIEVRYVGDKFVMLINKRDPGSNYYLAISGDGENWSFSNVPLFDVQMEALYKATFLPEFDENNDLYLNIFYTTNHSDTPDLKRKLFNVKTNSVTI